MDRQRWGAAHPYSSGKVERKSVGFRIERLGENETFVKVEAITSGLRPGSWICRRWAAPPVPDVSTEQLAALSKALEAVVHVSERMSTSLKMTRINSKTGRINSSRQWCPTPEGPAISPDAQARSPPTPAPPTRAGGAGRLTNSISTAPEKLSPANTVKGTRYVPVVSNM